MEEISNLSELPEQLSQLACRLSNRLVSRERQELGVELSPCGVEGEER